MSQDMNRQTEERNKTAEAKRPAPAGRRRKRRFGAGFAAGALSVLLIGICAWGASGLTRQGRCLRTTFPPSWICSTH